MSYRHKDLNNAHALLEGEGWHIEKGNSRTAKRRSKTKCIYYVSSTKKCKRKTGGCQGTADCALYREK